MEEISEQSYVKKYNLGVEQPKQRERNIENGSLRINGASMS